MIDACEEFKLRVVNMREDLCPAGYFLHLKWEGGGGIGIEYFEIRRAQVHFLSSNILRNVKSKNSTSLLGEQLRLEFSCVGQHPKLEF